MIDIYIHICSGPTRCVLLIPGLLWRVLGFLRDALQVLGILALHSFSDNVRPCFWACSGPTRCVLLIPGLLWHVLGLSGHAPGLLGSFGCFLGLSTTAFGHEMQNYKTACSNFFRGQMVPW